MSRAVEGVGDMRGLGRILVVLIAVLVVAWLGNDGEDDQTAVTGAAGAATSTAATSTPQSPPASTPAGPASTAPAASSTVGAPAGRPPATTEPTPDRAAGPAAPATPPPGGGQQAAALLSVVSVADGDTLTVDLEGSAERVRIIGIDTPEVGRCGADDARDALRRAVSDGVRLERDTTQDDRDRYARLLRHVVLADGSLAARQLIGAGHGREYTYDRPYRHRAAYLSAQRSARAQGKGVWGAECASASALAAPAPTRATKPTPSPTRRSAPAPRGGCTIKGNINSEGEKIYHVPDGRSYDRTKITTSKGEKWFCSESEAVAAGWRAARD